MHSDSSGGTILKSQCVTVSEFHPTTWLLDLPYDEAVELARANGHRVRVVYTRGHHVVVTRDYDPFRIGVWLDESNVVVRAEVG